MEFKGYILKINKKKLLSKIGKLNKKALRLGFEPIGIYYTGNIKKETPKDDELHVIVYEEVVITGESPHIDGWDLIAIFQKQSDAIFVRTFPNKEIPKEYHEKIAIHCEHCGYKRNRKKSYLLRKDNKYKEVGSTCLKNFFEVSIENFLFQASIDYGSMISEYGDISNFPILPKEIDLIKFLEMTSRCIEEFGWMSKGKAEYTEHIPTVVHVTYQLFTFREHMNPNEILVTTKFNTEEAVKVIDYFSNVTIGSINSYMENCKKIAISGYVPGGFEGIAASMISTYKMSIEKEIEKARKSENPSEWIGIVSEKIDIDNVVVKYANAFNGRWGLVHLYKFDHNGNTISWFASRSQGVEVGDVLTLKGTIKKLDTYNDEKITVCTRCKIRKYVYLQK